MYNFRNSDIVLAYLDAPPTVIAEYDIIGPVSGNGLFYMHRANAYRCLPIIAGLNLQPPRHVPGGYSTRVDRLKLQRLCLALLYA